MKKNKWARVLRLLQAIFSAILCGQVVRLAAEGQVSASLGTFAAVTAVIVMLAYVLEE